jgi:hypothetical protein
VDDICLRRDDESGEVIDPPIAYQEEEGIDGMCTCEVDGRPIIAITDTFSVRRWDPATGRPYPDTPTQ